MKIIHDDHQNGVVPHSKAPLNGHKALSDDINGHSGPGSPRNLSSRNQLNDLDASTWISETVSVWTQRGLGVGHPDVRIEKQHPAPFSFTDVGRLVRFFTKKGQTVLDPFVGVGSTLKACALDARNGIGFELNKRYVKLAKERLKSEVPGENSSVAKQDIKQGDARELIRKSKANSVDFVVTSPPYWNILHKEDHKARQERKKLALDTRYSNDTKDLGNLHSYPEFLRELSTILGDCGRVLRPKKYMALIVSDFRDKSKFIMFHSDLAASLSSYSLELRGMTVLYQRHKRVFPYGYPYAYVPNIHHQFILLLQNAKKE
jgi:DNA modification methylase